MRSTCPDKLALRLAGLLLAGAMACASAAAPDLSLTAEQAYRQGLAWRNGDGRPVDKAAALRLLENAAERGVPAAMFTLSHMLAEGEGTKPDRAGARRWLEAAAQLEYPEALQEMAMLEPDPQRAAELMREAGHALQHRARETP
jgi:TPR repeat protein